MWPFSASFDPDIEIPDLTGRTILVTGGSSGLGKECIRQYAKHNPTIYLAARNKQKSLDVIAELQAENPQANITWLELDLASLTSVASAVRIFLAANDRLDILMNNGGIMSVPEGLTKEGYEIQFGTNHLGHALLTKLLMPVLLKTAGSGADVRVINLTSIGQQHLAPKEGFLLDEVETTMSSRSTWERYGHSKLANVYFTKALAKRYPQIWAVAVHPGGVQTGLGETAVANSSRIVAMGLQGVNRFMFVDAATGVKGQLWASVGSREEVKQGAVYYPLKSEHKGRPLMNSEEMADKLWDWTEAALAKHGYSS